MLAFEIVIEPRVSQLVVIQTRVADAAFADHRVFRRAFVGAMERRRNHRVLLVGNLGRCSLAHVVEGCEVWTNRHVIPRHEPEPGYVDAHVFVPEPAFVPSGIVRLALNHRAARVYRHAIREDAMRRIDRR